MTSSSSGYSRSRKAAALFLMCWMGVHGPVRAALGQMGSSIEQERSRMRAFRSVQTHAQYTVHELHLADGSRIREFVRADNRIFAVSWFATHKPDLATWLGDAYGPYASAVQRAATQPGHQRHFLHQGADLVVQNTAYLNLFRGYAYHPSLLPPGFSTLPSGTQ